MLPDERLAEIEKAAKHLGDEFYTSTRGENWVGEAVMQLAEDDIPALLAEVKRLREERRDILTHPERHFYLDSKPLDPLPGLPVPRNMPPVILIKPIAPEPETR